MTLTLERKTTVTALSIRCQEIDLLRVNLFDD